MIDLLGKRPFMGKGDDMDKWLDENRGERSAPPPLETVESAEPESPLAPPAPVAAATRIIDRF